MDIQPFQSQNDQSTARNSDKKKEIKQFRKISKSSPYVRIFQLASTRDRLIFLCGVISSLGSGTVLPLMTLVFGHFVKIFTDFALGALDADAFRGQINHYALYFVYLFIAKLGLSYISMVAFTITSTNITSRIRRNYLRALLSQDIPFHEIDSSSGAVSLALTSSCNSIQSGLADKCGLALQEASMLTTAFIVAFASVWKLTLVVATVIPATVLVVGIGAVFDSKLEEKSIAANAVAATHADELIRSVRTARALRATTKLLNKYKSFLDEAERWGRKRSPVYGSQVAVFMCGMYVIYALACWYGIRLYSQGQISNAGQVITTLFCIIIGTTSFSRLAGYSAPFLKIQSASTELFRVIDKERQTGIGGNINDSPRSISDETLFSQDVRFEDVHFSYPLRPSSIVFDGLCLSIPAGKMTALVGPSGCGKSTIVGILERWYEPNEGKVTIGGVRWKDIPLGILRENIGLVQQEPFLFSTSILENILYGLPKKTLDLLSEEEKFEQVRSACEEADAHEFIERLPDGYNTFVGNRGTLLSGGQKQRIAIARAIIKNPKVLILDEATSALDAKSERIVQNALDRATRGRTTITIAHRLSTIRHADQIVVLEHGKVVETGTHEQLSIIENGKYRRLLEAQEIVQKSAPPNLFDPGDKEYINPQDGEDVLKPTETLQEEKKDNAAGDTPRQTKYSTLRALMRTLYDQRSQWIAYAAMFIFAVIGGAIFPLQAYLYAQLVNTFQLTGSDLVSRGNFWALMFTILAIVTGIAYFGIAALGLIFGQKVTQFYRFSYLNSMMGQPISYFDNSENSSGTLTARLDSNPESMQSLAGPNLGVVITVMTALISSVILSLTVGWKLSLVAIFAALPFIFGAGLVHESMENSFEEKASKTFEKSNSFATECVSAIKTVNSLTMESLVDQRYGDLLLEHGRRTTRYAFIAMVWFAISESIDFPCMALAFWYGGRLLSTGEYSTTQFFIVFVAIVLGAQSMGQFFAHAADISRGTTAANSIFSLQETVSKDDSPKQTLPNMQTTEEVVEDKCIELKDVIFAYPRRKEHRVLNHLSLTIKRGQYVALVGPSGCGKSTIISLIERFYDIDRGQILMGGIDVRRLETDDIRKNLALVGQEPFLYQGTIKENILLGCDHSIGDEKLEMIAKQAQIYDLIASLPEGFGTQVGAGGTALSGGQKQRVAIARAIAQDAPILLLDEATSALDSESERLVQDALKEAGKGRSVIAIAHRLSTIRHADIIYVMKDGYVAEEGGYDDLLERRGIFYAMVHAQAAEQL